LPAGANGVRIYRGTVTNTENVLVAQIPHPISAFTDTNLNNGAATPPATTSFGNVTKDAAGRATKANLPGGRSYGLDQTLYAGMAGWLTGVTLAGTTIETRNNKYAAAAGYTLQEV
jgi:hypothetical protein